VLWDAVTVGAGAVVEACILADGVTIPPGAQYAHSAVVTTPEGLLVAPL
jgi:acetyltransferase-like isoleucine patch superfamily enzyme